MPGANARSLKTARESLEAAGVRRGIIKSLEAFDSQLRAVGFAIHLKTVAPKAVAKCPYCGYEFEKARHDQVTCGKSVCKKAHGAKLWRRWKTQNA